MYHCPYCDYDTREPILDTRGWVCARCLAPVPRPKKSKKCSNCGQTIVPFAHPTLGPVCVMCLHPIQIPKPRKAPQEVPRPRAPSLEHSDTHFTASDPGYPLGRGMPLGSTLREDGESHRHAWARLIRQDPCSYCGRPMAGTVDHIEPKNPLKRCKGLGGVHTWLNYTAACESCNNAKRDMSLLTFLRSHRRRMIRLPTKEERDAAVRRAGRGDLGDRRLERVA